MDAITIVGHQPLDTWSPRDFMRLSSFTIVSLKNLELNYLSWADGNLSDELWFGARDGAIAYLAANPFIEQLWHQGLSDNFPPRYQAQIEELLTLATAALAENKTHRLSDDFLDLNLLDQQARDVLGMVRADEVVIR